MTGIQTVGTAQIHILPIRLTVLLAFMCEDEYLLCVPNSIVTDAYILNTRE